MVESAFASGGVAGHPALMWRCLAVVLTLAFLAGCAKPVPLPDVVVSAAAKQDFTRFNADLGKRFTPEQLKGFDTAVQELQLDAMHRDIVTAAEREADMLAVVNGKTVHAVTLLGWQARKVRFQREFAEITRMLEHDLKQAEKAPPAASLARRIGSEKEIQAKLQANLAETDRRLTELQSPTK